MPDEKSTATGDGGNDAENAWGERQFEFSYAEPQVSKSGQLEIASNKSSRIVAGETGKLIITYTHFRGPHQKDPGTCQIYNPFFNKFLRPPSFAIAVFDANRRFVMDLAWCGTFGKRFVLSADFMYFKYPGNVVGGQVDLPTMSADPANPPYDYPRLRPGKWKLQVILLDRFYPKFTMWGPRKPNQQDLLYGTDETIGLESDHHDEAVEAFLRDNPGKELLRSNIIEVEVVAPQK